MTAATNPKMPPVYMASVEAEPEGGFSVSFPDLEGCFSGGDTFEEAVRYASEAAAQWLEVKGTYPEASNPRAASKAIIKAGGIPVAVEAPALKVRTVPVTISLAEPVLRRIDKAAELQGLTRSAFIALASMQAAGVPPQIAGGGKRRRARAKAA